MTTIRQSHRVGIVTRYLAPTDYRGARIKARAWQGGHTYRSATVPYDHALDGPDNHARAAMRLIDEAGWQDHVWAQGAIDDGYVFVPCGEDCQP